MVFSSLTFLCFFLPTVMAVYCLIPERFRNGWLLTASLVFYAWGEPVYILLMIFSSVFGYGTGLLLGRCGNAQREEKQFQDAQFKSCQYGNASRQRKLLLAMALFVHLGLLGIFKYSGLVDALPVGISFYTFQILSYVIDVYRGSTKPQKNLVDFAMYVSLFPQLIAGPIVRYSDIEAQLKGRSLSADRIRQGLERFSVGLAKKVILANQIGALSTDMLDKASSITAGEAWIGAAAYMFQIYFDFSGYSDMAIGLGRMFGFDFPENFNYPYMADSVTDFWRRWHMTLGTWFREYVYIPLGGNRKGMKRQILNLFIVWSLTGIWHGAGWNFLLWGLYYFLFLVLEKMVLRASMERWPRALRHLYTLAVVYFGWVLFAGDSFTLLSDYVKAMAGFNGLAWGPVLYLVRNYGVLFVIMILGSTPLPGKMWRKVLGFDKGVDNTWKFNVADKINSAGKVGNSGMIGNSGTVEKSGTIGNSGTIEKSGTIGNSGTIEKSDLIDSADILQYKWKFFVRILFIVATFALCFIFLIGDSYNPFLYFRF